MWPVHDQEKKSHIQSQEHRPGGKTKGWELMVSGRIKHAGKNENWV